MTIDRFEDEWFFLSNFSSAKVMFEGREYPTAEHVYQAAKSVDDEIRQWIGESRNAAEAKQRGRRCMIRKDWDDVKLDVMREILVSKFGDAKLGKKLLDTGSEEIIEGNWWGDRFWGVCEDVGQNHLGKILMELREELRKEVE